MIRREILKTRKLKGFRDQHLGVSDFEFDPENRFKAVKVAKSVINQSFVQPWRNLRQRDDIPNSLSWGENRIATELLSNANARRRCKTILNANAVWNATKCKPRSLLDPSVLLESGDLTLIIIITGYITKRVCYTISTDIAIMKIWI